jgi:hypothetical protein
MTIAINKNNLIQKLFLISQATVIVALLISCGGRYGSLQIDQQAQEAFESDRLPMEYKYYYYGFDTEPYVIFGIEPKYEIHSKMWREAAPDTKEFKEMVRWIWEDYGYHKFGADILDPNGKKVGILYSAISQTTVKFLGDNQIAVMPNTPFLWGPDGNNARTP